VLRWLQLGRRAGDGRPLEVFRRLSGLDLLKVLVTSSWMGGQGQVYEVTRTLDHPRSQEVLRWLHLGRRAGDGRPLEVFRRQP
jgi:hypothetical protein